MKSFKRILFGLTLMVFSLANISVLNTAFAAEQKSPATQKDGEFYPVTTDRQANINEDSERLSTNRADSNRLNSNNSDTKSVEYDQSKSPYYDVLKNTITDKSLSSALIGGDVATGQGSQMFNTQVLMLIGYGINIFIAIGIAIAFFGGYKIMTSSKEETLKEGIRLVVFGLLGIIIMVSAKFISNGLVGDDGIITEEFASLINNNSPNGIQFANNLYQKILYPFIKVALYLVIGFLFFVMAGKVIGFVVSTDDSAKKKAGGIIIWCVVGILIVMGSKQMVEAVMGKQDDVINLQAQRIDGGTGGIGSEVLNFSSIPLISQVINWVMGLTMLIVLILIIIQAYRMFAKPDDPKNRERLKKTLLYIIIGVLVIGASYVISNVLIINKLPGVN